MVVSRCWFWLNASRTPPPSRSSISAPKNGPHQIPQDFRHGFAVRADCRLRTRTLIPRRAPSKHTSLGVRRDARATCEERFHTRVWDRLRGIRRSNAGVLTSCRAARDLSKYPPYLPVAAFTYPHAFVRCLFPPLSFPTPTRIHCYSGRRDYGKATPNTALQSRLGRARPWSVVAGENEDRLSLAVGARACLRFKRRVIERREVSDRCDELKQWMERCIGDGRGGWMDGTMYGLTERWIDGWMRRWMRWMDG